MTPAPTINHMNVGLKKGSDICHFYVESRPRLQTINWTDVDQDDLRCNVTSLGYNVLTN